MPGDDVFFFDETLRRWGSPFVMAAINTRVVRRSHALLGNPYGATFRYQEGTVTLAEAVALNGEVANVLNVEASSGRNARYYLSMHSRHILKRELLKDADTHQSDFQFSEGLT